MIKKLIYLLYQIFGLYMFFYALFSNTIFSFWGTIFKIVFFLLLLISLLYKKNCYPHKINRISVSLFYLYLLVVGILSISPPFDKKNEGFIMFLQFIYFPLYIYILLNFKDLTGRSYYQYFRYLINVACCFVILNIFFYFYEIPIWEDFRPWFGRISNGYPTTDVVCLAYALLIVLFVEGLNISNLRRIIYTVILILGIFSQASGTGMFMLFVILIVFLYCQNTGKNLILKKNFRHSITLVLILISSGFTILYEQEPDIANSALSLITNKISYFVGEKNVKTEWGGISFYEDTMEFREDEFQESQKLLKEPLDYITGIGFGNISTSYKYWKRGTMYVESQYACNLITMGCLGSLFFLFFICSPLKHWLPYKKTGNIFLFYMGILAILLALISCRTTIILFSPEIELVFALFYSILLRPNDLFGLSCCNEKEVDNTNNSLFVK